MSIHYCTEPFENYGGAIASIVKHMKRVMAAEFNGRKRRQPNGSPWTNNTVRRVLQNELYIGHYVFGKTLSNLGQPIVLPERDWVRAEVLDPMVAPELFKAAQMRLRNGRRLYTDDELKTALARLYSERG